MLIYEIFEKVSSKIKQIRVFFNSLEVVGRSSKTQLQVGKNINCITLRYKSSHH